MRPFRSLRSRFILLFVVFVVLLCTSVSGLAIWQIMRVASGIFVSDGMLVVDKAVSLIDGDSFEALAKSLNIHDPFYEETRLKLLDLKQLSSCRYLYSMAPVEGTIWRFIIDGSAPPGDEDFSDLGDEDDTSTYDAEFARVWETKQAGHSKIEYHEDYGWVLSIYAPVWNSAGKAVGIVGCDFGAEELFNTIRLNAVGQIVIVLVSIGAGLALMTFFLQAIFNRFTFINTSLEKTLETIAAGEEDLSRWIRVRCKAEEIKELSHFFNATMAKLKVLILNARKQTLTVFNPDGESVPKKTGKGA
ncbi:MAG: hypothetical protein LBD48_05715 [Treponema sp.]|nr:hypothetical protein [Treponema sp.]